MVHLSVARTSAVVKSGGKVAAAATSRPNTFQIYQETQRCGSTVFFSRGRNVIDLAARIWDEDHHGSGTGGNGEAVCAGWHKADTDFLNLRIASRRILRNVIFSI